MKRRIHSSLHSRHVPCDIQQLLQVKSKMIEIGRGRLSQSEGCIPLQKDGRSASVVPSRLNSPPHFLQLIGYSSPKVLPTLRVKSATLISNKVMFSAEKQNFSKQSKQAVWKFSKFPIDGKLCASCEQKNRYRPKLFKRRK